MVKKINQKADAGSVTHINPESINYSDGDILIFDNVRGLSEYKPLKVGLNLILLCIEGRLQMDIGSVPLMLHKNDVLISRSGVLIDNFLLSPAFECKILCLTDSVISDILHNNIENFNKAIYIQNRNVISLSEENIEQFTHYYWLIRNKMNQKENPLRKEVLYSVTRAMLLELSANLAETDTVEPRALSSHSKQIFDSFLNLLSTNDVKRHSVATYASWLSVSPKYLSILCSNYSNRSASEWIDRYVVEDIRYYLCNTDFSIKEVAYKLGFCNLSLFGTYVRRHFHQSPAVLRRHLRTA